MNNGIKILGAFVAGLSIGSGVSYIVVNRKAEKRIQDEIAKNREYYKNRENASNSEKVAADDQNIDENAKIAKKGQNGPQKAIVEGSGEAVEVKLVEKSTRPRDKASAKIDKIDPEKVNYGAAFDAEVPEEVVKQTSKAIKKGGKSKKVPKMIGQEDWESDKKFDKKTLTYFANGDVLMDDQTEEAVDDVDKLVGSEFYDCFGDEITNMCYVRNESIGADFEIERRIDITYEEFIQYESGSNE